MEIGSDGLRISLLSCAGIGRRGRFGSHTLEEKRASKLLPVCVSPKAFFFGKDNDGSRPTKVSLLPSSLQVWCQKFSSSSSPSFAAAPYERGKDFGKKLQGEIIGPERRVLS